VNAFDRAAVTATRNAIDRARDAMAMLQPDTSWLRQCELYDPAKAIEELRHEHLSGLEREVTQELDKRHRRSMGNSAVIPYETLALRSARLNATRADTVGTTTSGGYLVSTLNFPTAADALMSMLVIGRLGGTAVAADGPNLALPTVTTAAAPGWLSTETTQTSESDLTFGQTSFSPHTVGGYTEMSRLLTLQSRPNAGDLVARDLSRKLSRTIEAAAFSGSGAAGQPHGLTGLTNVNAVSGTTFALSTGLTAITDCGDALDDSPAGWATTRAVGSLLRQRQEFSGSSLTLWRGALSWGALIDFPGACTSGVASGTAFFGVWQYFVLVTWGGGLEVAINPFANFQEGIVGMRALATVDVGCVWPSAFSCVTGIT
jgi:HK97 family phage major capsid protein